MRLYRLVFRRLGAHEGFSWHTTRDSARHERRVQLKEQNDPDLEIELQQIELPTRRKADLVKFLNTYAEHPDNG